MNPDSLLAVQREKNMMDEIIEKNITEKPPLNTTHHTTHQPSPPPFVEICFAKTVNICAEFPAHR